MVDLGSSWLFKIREVEDREGFNRAEYSTVEEWTCIAPSATSAPDMETVAEGTIPRSPSEKSSMADSICGGEKIPETPITRSSKLATSECDFEAIYAGAIMC